MDYTFPRALYQDIMSLVSGLVVKRADLARKGETLESYRSFERYLACANGSRYFHTFLTFDIGVLRSLFKASDAARYAANPELIPEESRDAVVRLQAEKELEDYVEENPYYRTLNGLPPLNAKRTWIYIEDIEGIDPDTPLHELGSDKISAIEISGRLDSIIKSHPGEDFEYLKFLGSNSIGIIEARLARPFDILRLGPCASPHAEDAFRREYMQARRYVIANFYNRDLFTSKELYEPVIGIIMLCLAIRNAMVPDEKGYLNYDEVLDTILESYGLLKYFKKFPFTYKRRIVMALDKLLANKGTDGVLVDVCKLFSSDDLIANRYYLMKRQPIDSDGDVIITGNPDQDYTLEFLKTPIMTHDIDTDEINRLPYSITESDYLWQIPMYDDNGNITEQYRRLLNEDFNLLMSKYVDVEAAYDVTSLVFETCCFTNLLLYARDNLSALSVVNVYAANGKCNVFTMLIFLLATLSKRSGFDGNIVYDPLDIAETWTRYNLPEYASDEAITRAKKISGYEYSDNSVWRFAYEDMAEAVKEILDKYELNIDIDEALINGFDAPTLEAPSGKTNALKILGVYVRNRELYEAICKEALETRDIRKYEALMKCRNVLFTSASQRETFVKIDGTPAATYMELLKELDPRLARKVYNTGGTPEEIEMAQGHDDILQGYEEDLNGLAVYILERLEDVFNSNELKYLFLAMPSVYKSLIGQYITTAINVFKASSVQMRSINVFFKLGENDPVRVFDEEKTRRERDIIEEIHGIDEVGIERLVCIDEFVTAMDKAYSNA